MRCGVVFNISGNILALQDVERLFVAHDVTHRICLGGVAGMYPFVDECVAHLQAHRWEVLLDDMEEEFATGGKFQYGYSCSLLVAALMHARQQTSVKSLEYLRTRPEQALINGVRFLAERRTCLADPICCLAKREDARTAFTQLREAITFTSYPEPLIWHERPLWEGARQWHSGWFDLPPDHGRFLISPGGLGSRYRGHKKPCAMIFDQPEMRLLMLHPHIGWDDLLHRLDGTDWQGRFFVEEYEKRP